MREKKSKIKPYASAPLKKFFFYWSDIITLKSGVADVVKQPMRKINNLYSKTIDSNEKRPFSAIGKNNTSIIVDLVLLPFQTIIFPKNLFQLITYSPDIELQIFEEDDLR